MAALSYFCASYTHTHTHKWLITVSHALLYRSIKWGRLYGIVWQWVCNNHIGRRLLLISCGRLQRCVVTVSVHAECSSLAHHISASTHKFDRGLTHLLYSELHWLTVPQRIRFAFGVTDCSSMSAGQRSSAPCRLLLVYDQGCESLAAPLCKSVSADRATSPSHQFHRPSGVFCCTPDCLELAARLSTWYVS